MFLVTFKRWFAIALWQGVWICVLTLTALAQYRFDHWTADNGLPQNSVRDIVCCAINEPRNTNQLEKFGTGCKPLRLTL